MNRSFGLWPPPEVQISYCFPRDNCNRPKNGKRARWQDLGSNPASMHAEHRVDVYACLLGLCCQQSGAEQAHAQAWLTCTETWIALPREAWSDHLFNEYGTPTHAQPVVQLLRARYGHPDTDTFLGQHCDVVIVKKTSCLPFETWP